MTGTTPLLTIGDGGNEDNALYFNGVTDFTIGVDATATKLEICNGADLDATCAISVDTDEDVVITAGSLTIIDDENLYFGTGSDAYFQYDEGVDDQLLIVTTTTGAGAITDPLIEVLVPATPTANQQVFGVAKGTQASNTALLTVDEDGDAIITGDLTVTGSNVTVGAAGVKLTGDGDGALTLLGLGDGADEDLTINLDDSANTASFSSSTALDTIEFNAMAVNCGSADISDGNIANVGDISLDTITSDAGTVITINDGLVGLVDDVTCTAADPGLGVASLATVITTVVTDATGSAADEVSLADGTKGQIKIITLKTDGETTGLEIKPANMAGGSKITCVDAGDGVTLIFDGTNWVVVGNNGGTIS